jgi:hypothetical protein
MNFENQGAEGPILLLHSPNGPSGPAVYGPGFTIVGLRECETCILEVVNVRNAKMFIDDVEVRQGENGLYEWTAAFFAGRVEIVVAPAPDKEIVYYAFVGPATEKVADEQFDAMVGEIRNFRASLLLGGSSAATAFGNDAGRSTLEDLVRLARLRIYAPNFLREVRSICRAPHRSLHQAERLVSLARAKRLHPLASREPRIAAIVAGRTVDSIPLDSLQVATSTAVPTFDTPCNRALKALVTRLGAQVAGLLDSVTQSRLGGDPEEQGLRRPRRERFLRRLLGEVKTLLTKEPFSSVSRIETSS